MQDPIHLEVKAFRALMNKEFKIGSDIASRAQLLIIARQMGRVVLNLSEAQLSRKDYMNHDIASRACSIKVTSELKRPEEQALKAYLEAMRHIETAYIDLTSTTRERLFSAWYLACFFRTWRAYLKGECNRARCPPDVFKAVMQKNFVSPNLYTGLELNGHHLTIFHNQCRDEGRPQMFLPSHLNSQGCESGFRTYRACSSSGSTVTNMDIYEMIQRSNRLTIAEEAPTTIKDFVLKKNKPKDIFVPESLLSNEDVSRIVHDGFDEVKGTFRALGWDTIETLPEIQLTQLQESDDEYISEDEEEEVHESSRSKTEKLKKEVERDLNFMNNLDHALTSDLDCDDKLKPVDDDNVPKGFVAFERGGVRYLMKKASLVWCLGKEGKRVTTDRAYRFVNNQKEFRPDEKIMLGDFMFMKFEGAERLVQAIGFKFQNGKAFKGDYFAFKENVKEDKKNPVMVLCNFFYQDGDQITVEKCAPRYISVANYKRHVLLKRNLKTAGLTM